MRRWFRSWFRPLQHGLSGLRQAPLPMLRGLSRLCARAFWAVIAWCAGLNLRLFLQGLPALAVGIGAALVLGLALFTPTQEVEARYWDEAQSADKAKNYKEALTCYERLASFTSDRADVLYELALNSLADQQPERCLLLMHQLAAPARKGGYAKAHLWLAIRNLAQSPQTPEARQQAESHLLRALENGIADKETAHALLGDIYLGKKLFAEAERHLLAAVANRPQVRLRLAHLYAAQGNLARARTEATLAANLFSTAAQADLSNHYARLRWAEAVTFLEDFPKALAILQEGLSGTGADIYRPAIAHVYGTWFDLLSRTGNPNLGLRLNLLERGLGYDPKNILLLDRLLNVTRMHVGSVMTPYRVGTTIGLAASGHGVGVSASLLASRAAGKGEARSLLRQLLAKGEAIAQVHFALGLDAYDRGAVKEARVHWERAQQLAPDLPVIVNNLAWLLYQSGPSELPKALDMINLAIAKAPRETNFRDTRGHIYLKMGKYREALDDLESALPSSPNSAQMHRSLAEVYARLDMPKMAAEHQRLASNQAPTMENR